MRRDLGAFVTIVLAGCASPFPSLHGGVDGIADMDKRLDVTHGNCRLVVYSLGPDIEVKAVACNCLKGPTLLARVTYLPTGRLVATGGGGSEADPENIIDFSQAPEGIYRFTQCTWDPRADDQVPIFMRTVRVFADGSVVDKEEVVLKPEAGDPRRIDELALQALQEPTANADGEVVDPAEEAMGHLRNIGIDKPDQVLAALRRLRGKVHECSLQDFEGEIQHVRELKSAGLKQGR